MSAGIASCTALFMPSRAMVRQISLASAAGKGHEDLAYRGISVNARQSSCLTAYIPAKEPRSPPFRSEKKVGWKTTYTRAAKFSFIANQTCSMSIAMPVSHPSPPLLRFPELLKLRDPPKLLPPTLPALRIPNRSLFRVIVKIVMAGREVKVASIWTGCVVQRR